MDFTRYGRQLARNEAVPPMIGTGATAHANAIAYDAGLDVLLTGRDGFGRRFHISARSVLGAYATARAVRGVHRAWHRLPDGSRRLVFRR